MKLHRHYAVLAAACLILALGGCTSFKKQVGLSKQSPDEFRVVSRAPLSLPPDFQLRPPRPGAPRPQEGTATQQARRAVFRAPESAAESQPTFNPNDSRTPGEQALLKSAGSEKAEPNIRQIVDRETAAINEEGEYFVDSLIFWREEPVPGVLVDPEKEAKRLRENAALGRSVTEGETPTIERKEKGIFEGLF